MTEGFNFAAVYPVLPELILVVGAMALLMIGAWRGDRTTAGLSGLAVMLLVVAGVLIATMGGDKTVAFGGSFVVDRFAKFLKLLVLVGSIGAILLSVEFRRDIDRRRFEYPILILLATAGMLLLISAGDLIALYLGFETMSLALYVLAAIDRDSARATEAGLKYFVLGALSSGMLLYGASLIYGFAGTVSFTGIATAAECRRASGSSSGSSSCSRASASRSRRCRSTCGRPTSTRARRRRSPRSSPRHRKSRRSRSSCGCRSRRFRRSSTQWQQIIVFVSIASMALGSFAAIGQRNIKRLMAYSSIGHMGFALVGLAAGTSEGIQGVLVYMAIYVTMTLGTFACIIAMRRKGKAVEDLTDLAGLARTKPVTAFFFAMLMFSMAGVPPLAGFFAKFYVFLAAIQAGLFTLAVLGVISSVVGAYYYLLIVKIMYFDDPVDVFDPTPSELTTVLGITGLAVLLFFVYPSPLVNAAGVAAKSLF